VRGVAAPFDRATSCESLRVRTNEAVRRRGLFTWNCMMVELIAEEQMRGRSLAKPRRHASFIAGEVRPHSDAWLPSTKRSTEQKCLP
jgi:hypothetical protein